MSPATTPSQPSDLLVVDADTHLTEPWDLWTSRAPAQHKDRLPHVEHVNGDYHWVFDGTPVGKAGAVCVFDRDGQKHLGSQFLFTKYIEDVTTAASQVEPRLAFMDSTGVWAQLVYPNAIGFGGQQLGAIGDLTLRRLAVEIYNDAMADLQRQSGNRLFPMGVVPWWDLDLAVTEIQRLKQLGIVGVNTVADPQEHGLLPLSDEHWRPMFEALEDTDLTLNFHIGASATQQSYFGSAPWPNHSADNKLAIGSAMIFLANARIFANFIYGGIFERHPKLKLVSVESGVGWVPFFLTALDYQLQETAPETAKQLSLTPTEYFRRQCAACFWFEAPLLVENIKYLGEDNCLFETDFPHPTCLYPSPVDRALKALDGESDTLKRKVLGGNAARIYNLPTPK